MKTDAITQQRLKELLHYDADTGVFTWLERTDKRFNALNFGKKVGYVNAVGYVSICVDNVKYAAHRLAWLYVHGNLPEQIDHINHDRVDNRLVNLRAANDKINTRNTSKRTDNTSGVVGVSWEKRRKKWQVHACSKFLGYFDDFFEAVCARKSIEPSFGFHPNHGKA